MPIYAASERESAETFWWKMRPSDSMQQLYFLVSRSLPDVQSLGDLVDVSPGNGVVLRLHGKQSHHAVLVADENLDSGRIELN